MKHSNIGAGTGALAALLLAACTSQPAPAPETTQVVEPASSAPSLSSGIEAANFDTATRAQDDFFRYVNGKWIDRTEIPADKPIYGAFTKLRDDSDQRMRDIIEGLAGKGGAASPGSEPQKIGDFYASFIDEAKLETLGLKPLAAELARVDALKDKKELPALWAHFERIGVALPYGLGIDQDAKEATRYTVIVGQSGLGLPDRDYYLSKEPKLVDLRAKYVAHVTKMFTLAGVKDAAKAAKDVVALETKLAEKQWPRVDERDADKTYHKVAMGELPAATPGYSWATYAKDAGFDQEQAVIVREPSYFKELGAIIKATPIASWKTYLRWQVIHAFAAYLSKAYVDENFGFYGTALNGIPENQPRWKRGVQATNGALGEAIGKLYADKYFPPEAKARMEQLVANLLEAYRQSITDLDWMGPETRQKALAKLAKFSPKIGYPNKWRDYSALTVARDDLVGNVIRATEFEYDRNIHKLGKPIDREEWEMYPQTVNAYYKASKNEIVFPAAILQPPFFNLQADDAVNYGGIGAVIGHEIGHGFDDQGSKFDGDGNLKSWWTDDDRAKFEARVKNLIEQYNGYEPVKGFHVNGQLTIGENIGDLGGSSIAYKAYHIALKGKPSPVIDGLTGEQRFFMGWAQVWRAKYRDEYLINLVKTNPHSPNMYRCNGVVTNLPDFYTAFGVKEGDKMYKPPEQRVKIW